MVSQRMFPPCYTVCVHVVHNLANGKDVEETNARVDSYRKENEVIIRKNRMKQVMSV